MREITCELCGKTFKHEGRARVLYCSEECRAEVKKINRAKCKKHRRLTGENNEVIKEIAVKAANMGMSYGKYVALGLDKEVNK